MTLEKGWGIAVAATAAVTLAGWWAWRVIGSRRRKSPDELERLRRLEVNAHGRIIPGRIVELVEPVPDGPAGPILLYDYEVGGVTYEAAQELGTLPEIAAAAPFLPGQITSVKYDPRLPTNSIVACETWSGIPGLEHPRNVSPVPGKESAPPAATEAPTPESAQGGKIFPLSTNR